MGISLPPHSFPTRFYITKMARPNRNDVDYFPLYCKEGKTMHFIRKKFGNDGYVVWIRTLRALAIKNYHYLDFNDETELLFHASDCDVEPNVVLGVLDFLAQFGEIDKEFWENKVVWSEKFIDSIKDAYRKRAVKIQLRSDILRLSSALNHISSAVNEVSSAINPQRKEEKSKEENIKEKSRILWKEIVKPSQWLDAVIKNNFTTKQYLLKSLELFWVTANYLENPIDDVNEVKKHFANWLKTNPPKKVNKDYNPLMEGKSGEDYHLCLTPIDEDRVQEMINKGWVKTPQGMVLRIKKSI